MDDALDWLQNAVTRGFTNYRFFSQHDPLLANLRGDERFQTVIADARARHARLRV